MGLILVFRQIPPKTCEECGRYDCLFGPDCCPVIDGQTAETVWMDEEEAKNDPTCWPAPKYEPNKKRRKAKKAEASQRTKYKRIKTPKWICVPWLSFNLDAYRRDCKYGMGIFEKKEGSWYNVRKER